MLSCKLLSKARKSSSNLTFKLLDLFLFPAPHITFDNRQFSIHVLKEWTRAYNL